VGGWVGERGREGRGEGVGGERDPFHAGCFVFVCGIKSACCSKSACYSNGLTSNGFESLTPLVWRQFKAFGVLQASREPPASHSTSFRQESLIQPVSLPTHTHTAAAAWL
jgi:hypothetical protein